MAKQIDITISISEIMKELARFAYTVGENLPDDQAKMRHFIQGLADHGHGELVKQRLDMAWADVLDTVSAYLVDHECKCTCPWCQSHRDSCDCDCDDCSGESAESADANVCPVCGAVISEEQSAAINNNGGDEMGYLVPSDRIYWQDYTMTLHFPDDVYPTQGRRIATAARTYMTYQGRSEWETLTGRDNARSELQAQHALNRLRVTIHTRTKVGKTSTEWGNFFNF